MSDFVLPYFAHRVMFDRLQGACVVMEHGFDFAFLAGISQEDTLELQKFGVQVNRVAMLGDMSAHLFLSHVQMNYPGTFHL